MFRLIMVILVVLVVALPTASYSQWQLDGAPLSSAVNHQQNPVIVSDGQGGAIIAWTDSRDPVRTSVYVQRVNSSGVVLWTWDGTPVASVGSQDSPAIESDGAGGAIVAWLDYRNATNDIYAQRFNAQGIPQWNTNGVVMLTSATQLAYNPMIASDGAGGAIVTWWDARNLTDYDIYAQRVNAAGVVQWATDGALVCGDPASQNRPVITADGNGGAIIAWDDYRAGDNIYAQRINASGVRQWTNNGVALAPGAGQQIEQVITSNGSGGAIVAWSDLRNGSYDIYAQRIEASGATAWPSAGVALCTAGGSQNRPRLATDGAGGAIVTWQDQRNGSYSVYARRVNSSGAAMWVPNGSLIAFTGFGQWNPEIVADGSGGAIVAWNDARNNFLDVFAQHVTGLGSALWTANGLPFSTAANHQQLPVLAADGAGGAIVAWQDNRYDVNDNNIYAQRIDGRYGYWGRLEPILDSASDNPHDQGGKVALNWRASDRDVLNQQFIYSYTIWRALDAAAAQSLVASGGASVFDQPVANTSRTAQHVLWHELTATTGYYWELIGTQIADYDATYSFLASTRQDSTASSTATHSFRVVAQGSSQFYNWPSNVLTAHSVDNLAPAAPPSLTAERNGVNVVLTWHRVRVSDFKNYTVYRKTSSGVTPIVPNFLTDAIDSTLTDASAPAGPLYYIVTATDVHGNQSAPSNEAAVSGATGVGNLPPVTALTVLQNYPNPFAGETQMQIGLPARGDVRVEIYDVGGRRVRSAVIRTQARGWNTLRLDALDDHGAQLPSGVYFLRVHAKNETVTRKMVIAR